MATGAGSRFQHVSSRDRRQGMAENVVTSSDHVTCEEHKFFRIKLTWFCGGLAARFHMAWPFAGMFSSLLDDQAPFVHRCRMHFFVSPQNQRFEFSLRECRSFYADHSGWVWVIHPRVFAFWKTIWTSETVWMSWAEVPCHSSPVLMIWPAKFLKSGAKKYLGTTGGVAQVGSITLHAGLGQGSSGDPFHPLAAAWSPAILTLALAIAKCCWVPVGLCSQCGRGVSSLLCEWDRRHRTCLNTKQLHLSTQPYQPLMSSMIPTRTWERTWEKHPSYLPLMTSLVLSWDQESQRPARINQQLWIT